MAYKLIELELSHPFQAIRLAAEESGVGLVARWEGRLAGFEMLPLAPHSILGPEDIERLASEKFASRVLAMKTETELRARSPTAAPRPFPTLSVAICTKDRAQRLTRLLSSLDAIRGASRFASLEIVVVDNASGDDSTRQAAGAFDDIVYVVEPKTGLDFARNAALIAASGDLIAFLDDDVVVDRDWLAGLAEAWESAPDAAGFTGLVLPYRLDTEAQIYFESRGGFGRGFVRKEFRKSRLGNPLHPVGSGILGAGCNMAFNRRLLIELGGFDEALDTGAPLPGGGDLDIFYRVLCSGGPIVYEPRFAVYHEHRQTLPQLRRQYWSWGLGMMAYLVKSRRADRAFSDRQSAMLRWWFFDQGKAVLRAALRRRVPELWFCLAELFGGIRGLAGEYDRSRRRVDAIRKHNP